LWMGGEWAPRNGITKKKKKPTQEDTLKAKQNGDMETEMVRNLLFCKKSRRE